MSWNQAQQTTWSAENSNYSEYSDEEDYSDDEYAPIEATSWGNQTVTQDGTTEINLTMSGWQSLIDPSIKLKAGGVGSGQLHRKGANFKPLDEQLIVQQRLGKPIPKALGRGKKKKGGKPKGPPPAAPRRPVPKSSLVPPSSSAYRGREPVAPVKGPWGSGELSSTPFWEQPASSATTGTFASKYATAPPTTLAPAPAQQPLVAPAAPPRQPEPARPAFNSRLGSAASKYATPQPTQQPPVQQQYQQQQQPPVQQQYQQQQKQQQPPAQQYQQPQAQLQQPIQSRQDAAPAPPLIYHKLDAPCLNFNIEMTPGVSANLLVYEDDDPVDVVNQFEKDHKLNMSEVAKRRFAEKVSMLLAQYKAQ